MRSLLRCRDYLFPRSDLRTGTANGFRHRRIRAFVPRHPAG